MITILSIAAACVSAAIAYYKSDQIERAEEIAAANVPLSKRKEFDRKDFVGRISYLLEAVRGDDSIKIVPLQNARAMQQARIRELEEKISQKTIEKKHAEEGYGDFRKQVDGTVHGYLDRLGITSQRVSAAGSLPEKLEAMLAAAEEKINLYEGRDVCYGVTAALGRQDIEKTCQAAESYLTALGQKGISFGGASHPAALFDVICFNAQNEPEYETHAQQFTDAMELCASSGWYTQLAALLRPSEQKEETGSVTEAAGASDAERLLEYYRQRDFCAQLAQGIGQGNEERACDATKKYVSSITTSGTTVYVPPGVDQAAKLFKAVCTDTLTGMLRHETILPKFKEIFPRCMVPQKEVDAKQMEKLK